MVKLVGITGFAGSGKSLASKLLAAQHRFERLRFAEPIKAALLAMGLTPRHVDGDLKEVPCEYLCGKTPRYAMQTLGTEWGRQLIGNTIWLDILAHRARASMRDGCSVVVDDVRFPNEAERIKEEGGTLIRIVRPGTGPAPGATPHPSEALMVSLSVDAVVVNDGSIDDLYDRLLAAINHTEN